MSHEYLLAAGVAFGLLTVAWCISALIRRADIIDPCWGLGFAAIAVAVIVQSGRTDFWPAILTVIWGLRLFLHLVIRWWGEEHEDRRYSAMRAKGSDKWWLQSLATVFWLQAAIMWALCVPLLQAVASGDAIHSVGFAIGAAVWAVGLFFEAIGDWQLTQFRGRPDSNSQVLKTGLWKYTRHPNYFGDFLVWWGLYIMCVAYGASWVTIYAPVVMSLLLMKFSGVGMLEKDISERRPGYREYVESTPTFFPWFPGKRR